MSTRPEILSLLVVGICASPLWLSEQAEAGHGPPSPLVLLEATKPALAPPGWVPVVSEQEGFRIYLPAEPQVERQTVDTRAGGIEMVAWIVAPEGALFMVSVTSYPPPLQQTLQQHPDDALAGFRNAFVAKMEGKLLSDKSIVIKLAGPRGTKSFPGREFENSTSAGLRAVTQVFLIDGRLLQVSYARERGSDRPFRQMMQSLSLL